MRKNSYEIQQWNVIIHRLLYIYEALVRARREETSACERTRFARYEIMRVSCREVQINACHERNIQHVPADSC